jgi:hypothetical protein
MMIQKSVSLLKGMMDFIRGHHDFYHVFSDGRCVAVRKFPHGCAERKGVSSLIIVKIRDVKSHRNSPWTCSNSLDKI